MAKRILVGLLVVLVTATITFVLATRSAPQAEEPAQPGPTLDPDDPTARWPPRYRGKPLLLIIEAYVLDAIGELPPGMQRLIPDLVQRTFGGGDDWRASIRRELRLAPTIDQTIREGWERYQRAAGDAGYLTDPLEFAQQFADALEEAMEPGAGDGGADAGSGSADGGG